MTVFDLIAALRRMPMDANVFVPTDTRAGEATEVRVVRLHADSDEFYSSGGGNVTGVMLTGW